MTGARARPRGVLSLAAGLIAAATIACGDGATDPSVEVEPRAWIRSCVLARFPDIPVPCIDAHLRGNRELGAAIVAYELFQDAEGANEYARRICRTFLTAIDDVVRHSSDVVPAQEPTLTWTEVCLRASQALHPSTASAPRLAAAAAAPDVDELHPCGDAEGRKVLCASPSFPDGDVVTMAMVMTGPIPLDDATYHHQFGFVFDSDGDGNNNYRASPQYPNDFFDDTDRWYVAAYTPQQGWSIQVSDATGGTIRPATSAARIVIDGQVMQLVVPAGELATSCPRYRMTAFSHLGDYGLSPPHEWSGDVEPAVHQPLEDTCVELPPYEP